MVTACTKVILGSTHVFDSVIICVSYVSYELVIVHLLYLCTYPIPALSGVMFSSVLIVPAVFSFGIFSMAHFCRLILFTKVMHMLWQLLLHITGYFLQVLMGRYEMLKYSPYRVLCLSCKLCKALCLSKLTGL